MAVRAHGKVILLGEHSVVYGRPAIAAAIARGVSAEAQPAERSTLTIAPWDVTVSADPSAHGEREQGLSRAFAAVLSSYTDRPRVAVHADVELPGGAGLGCSAALGVAVVRAIDESLGAVRSDTEVAERSLQWERVFHGTPSGVDNAVAAAGGLVFFRRGEPLEPLAVRSPIELVVAHSGEASETRGMVEDVARQHRAAPARLEQLFDGIAVLVQNARAALALGDREELGRLMNLDHALLSAMLLSTERLEEMCSVAREAGAYGAKLTGGGGGGCMIALVDGDRRDRVLGALQALGRDAFVATAGAR